MDRRTLLTAAFTLSAGPTFALPSGPRSTDSEITRLFRVWQACWEQCEAASQSGTPESEFDRLCELRRSIEEQMFDLPCTAPVDALAKVVAFTCNGEDLEDGKGWSQRIASEAVATLQEALA